jgi:hypothetical protein
MGNTKFTLSEFTSLTKLFQHSTDCILVFVQWDDCAGLKYAPAKFRKIDFQFRQVRGRKPGESIN